MRLQFDKLFLMFSFTFCLGIEPIDSIWIQLNWTNIVQKIFYHGRKPHRSQEFSVDELKTLMNLFIENSIKNTTMDGLRTDICRLLFRKWHLHVNRTFSKFGLHKVLKIKSKTSENIYTKKVVHALFKLTLQKEKKNSNQMTQSTEWWMQFFVIVVPMSMCFRLPLCACFSCFRTEKNLLQISITVMAFHHM